jgi:hypothetical protein
LTTSRCRTNVVFPLYLPCTLLLLFSSKAYVNMSTWFPRWIQLSQCKVSAMNTFPKSPHETSLPSTLALILPIDAVQHRTIGQLPERHQSHRLSQSVAPLAFIKRLPKCRWCSPALTSFASHLDELRRGCLGVSLSTAQGI